MLEGDLGEAKLSPCSALSGLPFSPASGKEASVTSVLSTLDNVPVQTAGGGSSISNQPGPVCFTGQRVSIAKTKDIPAFPQLLLKYIYQRHKRSCIENHFSL